MLSDEILECHLNIIVAVEVCGIPIHIHFITHLNLEILNDHAHLNATIASEFFVRIDNSQLSCPLGDDNQPVCQVRNVDIYIFTLVTSLKGLLLEVSLNEECAIRY